MEPNISPKEQAVRIINAHILSNSEEIEDSASKMLEHKKVFEFPKNVPLNKIISSLISRLYEGLDQLSSEGRDKNTRYRNYLLATIEIIELLDSTLNSKYFASAAKLHDACLLSKHIEKHAKKVNVNSRFKQTTLDGDILPDHQICLADILAMEHSLNDGPLFSIPFTTIFDKSGKVSEDFTGIANILSKNGKLTPEMLEKLTLSKLE
jgi:hypothetical protein